MAKTTKADRQKALATKSVIEVAPMSVEIPRIPGSFKIDLGIGAPRRFKIGELTDDMLIAVGTKWSDALMLAAKSARK